MSGLVSQLSTSVSELLSAFREHVSEYSASMAEHPYKALLPLTAGAGTLLLWTYTRPRLPPGPRALPLIGNLHQMSNDPRFYLYLDQLKKDYGDIVTLYMGPKPIVFLNSAELVREAFMRQSDVTSNRPYMLIFEIFGEGRKDIVSGNYEPRVQMQRKLAHQALRKFSQGGGLEKYTSQAFQAMCEALEKNPEMDGPDMGFLVAYNILLSMAFGKKFDFSDPFFREMIDKTKELDELFEFFSLSDLFPIFRHLPYSKSNRCFQKMMERMLEYFEKTWDDHMDTFVDGKVTDFTYQLISVMKEAEQDKDDRKNMKLLNKRNYIHVINDLFFAGTDTTRMTLNWVWHYLAAFPECQRRAQEEVDRVLGRDGEVTAKCREKLPYVDAFLHEVMRIRPVVEMGIFHETAAPIQLAGYNIPSGTTLVCNTWSIHMDAANWTDPEAFLPSRWLDDEGHYVFQQQGFVPFSMGRRSCIGESFVKIELHMLTTMFLQKFTVEPSPGYTASVKPVVGGAMQPEAQKPFIVKPR